MEVISITRHEELSFCKQNKVFRHCATGEKVFVTYLHFGRFLTCNTESYWSLHTNPPEESTQTLRNRFFWLCLVFFEDLGRTKVVKSQVIHCPWGQLQPGIGRIFLLLVVFLLCLV